jgi:PIN domain nuclease of toxin-antitoxin system
MRLLLDTSAFLFSILEPAKLSESARQAILDEKNSCLLSPVSICEIAIKVQIGKLPVPPEGDYFEQHRQSLGAAIHPLNINHSYRLFRLPPHHKDPFDRMLIAQAIEDGLTVVTPDRAFRAYAVQTIW